MDLLYRGLAAFWRRFPPFGGWLSFFLLAIALLTVISSLLEAEWVPEINVVVYTAIAGLLLAVLLAHRRTAAWLAWSLIAAYILVISVLFLARLYPLDFLALNETRPVPVMIRQNLALFADRAGGWWLAVSGGGSSEETIVFALGLALLVGLLAAFAAWSTYRQRQPLPGMIALGMALAVNGYFDGSSLHAWLLALFLACTVLLVALLHFAREEVHWAAEKVDYSEQIRLELLMAATGIALGLTLIALILPAINIRAIAETFRRSPPVAEAEDTLERVFAGVRDPFIPPDPSGPGGRGIMPRAFLLGNAPELAETVVMTATTSPVVGQHWRAISYDTYTGRGWARSEERLENFAAGDTIPLPTYPPQITVTQEVNWILDTRRIRYTIGLPRQFDQPVSVAWRGVDDLVRVNGEVGPYSALSLHTPATAEALRRVDNAADAPLDLVARYTQLPEDVPGRVRDLAHEITAGQTNDFDRAVSMERFLRQYPYDLNVAPPPAGQDPVEYFLFELQRGYCDYYASAMVVLARAVGLPARLAIGYLAQTPDENGIQTIFHLNAHSWAEVYFAGHGWVEFEPTAAFPAAGDQQLAAGSDMESGYPPEIPAEPPPIPDPAGQTLSPWWAIPLILGLIAAFILFTLWLDRRRPAEQSVWQAYAALQQAAGRLGSTPQASQTPAEFEHALVTRLDYLSAHPRPGSWLADTEPGVHTITSAYNTRRYSPRKEDPVEDRRVWQTWSGIRRPLWLTGRWLALRRWINRLLSAGKE